MTQVKRLNKNEEKALLFQAMDEGDFLDHGSSRAVYDLGDGTVLKVAIDRKGQYQNGVEINKFKEQGSEYLAEIFSYGKYVVRMEKVEPLDYSLVEDMIFDYENEFDEEEFEERCGYEPDRELQAKIVDTYDFLSELLGETADNYQIGLRNDGKVVAYDYGYEPCSHELSVSGKIWKVLRDDGDFGCVERVIDKLS